MSFQSLEFANRRERSGRETFRDQRYRDHFAGAVRRRDDAKVCGLSNGSDRRSHLRCRSIHHGAANRMVRIGCQRCVRPMAGARLPWIAGNIHPYYVMSALYLIVFSIGEAFYSPRVYEYAAAIAPPGQEASYGSLGTSPSSWASSLSALVDGYLPRLSRNRGPDIRVQCG